jgi:hypothetical protein
MKIKSVLWIMLGATAVLLIPLIAMQFTSEVNWTGSDFAVAWVLLMGIGFGLMMTLNKTANWTNRIAGSVIILGLLWLWAELAVGVFTNWGS